MGATAPINRVVEEVCNIGTGNGLKGGGIGIGGGRGAGGEGEEIETGGGEGCFPALLEPICLSDGRIVFVFSFPIRLRDEGTEV